MKVRVTAVKTIGWITKGESKVYCVNKIEDHSDYISLFIHNDPVNANGGELRCKKDYYKFEFLC